MGHFAGLLRQGFVVIGAGGKRVEREVKLIFPAEFKAGLRHRVIANLRARMAFRQVRSVGGNFVGDKPLLHVLFVGQTEVLFWRHIAEHGATEPADHCRTNSGGEVVVTRGNIGGQRPQWYRMVLHGSAPVLPSYCGGSSAWGHGPGLQSSPARHTPRRFWSARPACAVQQTALRRWHHEWNQWRRPSPSDSETS